MPVMDDILHIPSKQKTGITVDRVLVLTLVLVSYSYYFPFFHRYEKLIFHRPQENDPNMITFKAYCKW